MILAAAYLAIVAVIYAVMRIDEPGRPDRPLPHLRIWLWPWGLAQIVVCLGIIFPLCVLMARR